MGTNDWKVKCLKPHMEFNELLDAVIEIEDDPDKKDALSDDELMAHQINISTVKRILSNIPEIKSSKIDWNGLTGMERTLGKSVCDKLEL